MRKRISLIKREMEKRANSKYESDFFDGAELKQIRLNRSMSLAAACYRICSTSYLSKLENNKIIASRNIVYSLCEAYGLPEKTIKAMFNLKKLLAEAVDCFFDDNKSRLQEIMDNVAGLSGFRYLLISFIYQIYNLDLFNAERSYKKLLGLLSTFSDNDFEVFALFSAIYNYQSGDFVEALDNINSLASSNTKIIRFGYSVYYFYINYAMFNLDVIKAYNDLYDVYLKNGKYNDISKISYYMAIFYLKNNCVTGYNDMLDRVSDNYKKYLYFYYVWLIENRIDKTLLKSSVNEFSKCLIYLNSKTEYVKDSLSNHYGLVEPDYDYYYLEYQLLNKIEEKMEYLEVMVDYLKRSPNEFLRNYFIKEAIRLTLETSKYKTCSNLAYKLINIKG